MLCNTTKTVSFIASAKGSRPTEQTILVVDDETRVLATLGAFLAKAGFTVQKTADGDEALRMIASDPAIEVLVTDFAMPGMCGTELISQAERIRPNLKALMITGYPDANERAQLPPDTTVLVKPFRRSELIAEVRSLLGDRQVALN